MVVVIEIRYNRRDGGERRARHNMGKLGVARYGSVDIQSFSLGCLCAKQTNTDTARTNFKKSVGGRWNGSIVVIFGTIGCGTAEMGNRKPDDDIGAHPTCFLSIQSAPKRDFAYHLRYRPCPNPPKNC
jgi:hypothetical protein